MRVSSVNKAITAPRLNYGVNGKALAICWGPIALISVLVGTSQGWIWSAIPVSVGLLIHSLLTWIFKKDPRILDIYVKYAMLANEYHPHTRDLIPMPFERPEKAGRGVRL